MIGHDLRARQPQQTAVGRLLGRWFQLDGISRAGRSAVEAGAHVKIARDIERVWTTPSGSRPRQYRRKNTALINWTYTESSHSGRVSGWTNWKWWWVAESAGQVQWLSASFISNTIPLLGNLRFKQTVTPLCFAGQRDRGISYLCDFQNNVS